MRETITRLSRHARILARVPAALVSRFLATGALVGGAHPGLVTLAVLVGVPIQVALAVSFAIALVMHFTINRQWVFAPGSGLHFSRQGLRYVVVAAVSYTGTATSVAFLPGLLGLPELAVFFMAAAAMACVSFVGLNFCVFRATPGRSA
jgi:putative flippase GtrA